ncbi:hypothetical protein [Aquibaculum sediminis]|uniref:hypothetical protein n=1 Tax=Aquibaculum sediminis TaxID=3231907 RepID=UPI003453888F
MSPASEPWRPRRLLLSLSEESDPGPLLTRMAGLAHSLETEVMGVLVEEAALYDLAALAFSTEMGAVTRRPHHLEAAELAARARRQEAAVRRALEGLGERLGRPVPLEVLRGHRLDPLRRAGREDLVFSAGALALLEDRTEATVMLECLRHTAGFLLSPLRGGAAPGPLVASFSSQAMAESLLPGLQRLAGAAGMDVQITAGGFDSLLAGVHLAERARASLLVADLPGGAGPEHVRALRLALRRLTCPLLLVSSDTEG